MGPARWLFASVCVALMGGAAFVVAMDENRAAHAEPKAGPVVKLLVKGGHGSGAHIGGGYVLTATHVTSGNDAMSYLRDDGKTGGAVVLWENKTFDIALVKLDTAKGISAANLECRTPAPGEDVVLRGNPLILNHITTWGRISGAPLPIGPWGNLVPVDASIAGGMSGGGLFDRDGDLIGINVGMMIQPRGYSGTAVGLSLAVPGSTICELLARTA